jgi:hypothetical protein
MKKKKVKTPASIQKELYARNVLDIITKVACAFYKEEVLQVVSKHRKKEIVMVRQIISYIARDTHKLSFRLIGEYFNQNEFATMYSCSAIEKLIVQDIDLLREIDTLKRRMFLSISMVNIPEVEKNFYIVDMNDCVSIKLKDNRSIVLSGFTNEEVRAYIEGNNIRTKAEQHKNTGVYLLKPLRNGLLNGK